MAKRDQFYWHQGTMFAPISNKKLRNSNQGREFSFKILSRVNIAHYSILYFFQNKRDGNFHTFDLNFSTFWWWCKFIVQNAKTTFKINSLYRVSGYALFFSNLALTDRNIQVKLGLKRVLESWDVDITTTFYWMSDVRHLWFHLQWC
jgi:hypothetical protein